jgi:flagellar protein FlaI
MPVIPKNKLNDIINKNIHLKEYIDHIKEKYGLPEFYDSLPNDLKNEKYVNIIYPTKGFLFTHLYRTPDMEQYEYNPIEPKLDEYQRKIKKDVLFEILKKIPEKEKINTDDELKESLKELCNEIITVDEKERNIKKPEKKDEKSSNKFLNKKNKKIRLNPIGKKIIDYYIIKELIGGGELECLLRDPYIEDIHLITGEFVHIIHKLFGMTKTNVKIKNDDAKDFVKILSDKMGNPVSEGRPIVDGILPDGSRGNIIYSSAISIRGPSMTIRRFTETPISFTQLIKWKTLSSGICAYLWICLQYGRSFFLCGGTACGKTTTMNAIVPFIPPEKKIYTAESTPELQVPHDVWQRLLTKTTGPKDGRVDLFDLLKAALRSRPDYIIPGEVRGAEGNIVFQAMQTGHPCMTTFHAGSVTKVIQRFTGDPINVPKTFMDNLDFVLIQLALERDGKLLRRCVSIDEIEGYNKEMDGIMSRKAFEWKPETDEVLFKAYNNSFILEQKIAKNAGYLDTSEIYHEYDLRKKIIEKMVDEKIFDYYEVIKYIWKFYKDGEKGLPFNL